ncbi:MAG: class 1 fructose-bisphosphatase [Gemmatimonadetes bacterium]|nr:class 1 fructose-bisphosphatase [Gemmatimonadota bacterium]
MTEPSSVRHRTTLTQHLLSEVEQHTEGGGRVAGIIAEIATACKGIRARLAQVGLGPLAGMEGSVNVQGEAVHKLDWFANQVLKDHFAGSGLVCALVSEEMEEVVHLDGDCERAGHVLCYDPMDGSSNLDVDGAVGTIFSLRRRVHDERHATPDEVFRPGTEQVAAGYVLYGPACMLVYAVGGSVHGFTLDTAVGEFFLSHPDIRMPGQGREYSANVSRLDAWDPGYRAFVESVSYGGDGDRTYSLRYIGALVADFHRILFRGGVFFYPADVQNPNGKLRLLYEAAPLAFLAEAAGGTATDGSRPILDIVPESLHQRTPLVIGSRHEVEAIESLIGRRESIVTASKGALR